MTFDSYIEEPAQPLAQGRNYEPGMEAVDNFYVLLNTLQVLRQYLKGHQASVLANQFLYYAQGFPKLRTAPDVMVIFDVQPRLRDGYKIWEEGQIPVVIFEITGKETEDYDKSFKRILYEQLGVREYWLFDPKGEWIPERLRGYRLRGEVFEEIFDGRSDPLQLSLAVEGDLISFYREDNGKKLLTPDELLDALEQENLARIQAEQRAEQEHLRLEQLEMLLARYQQHFGNLPD